jgi:hypothetical protein
MGEFGRSHAMKQAAKVTPFAAENEADGTEKAPGAAFSQ